MGISKYVGMYIYAHISWAAQFIWDAFYDGEFYFMPADVRCDFSGIPIMIITTLLLVSRVEDTGRLVLPFSLQKEECICIRHK